MYKATTQSGMSTFVKPEDYINQEDWFGKTWLLGVGCGFSTFFFLVEADHESDVIDAFVDSDRGHLLKVEEPEEGHECYAGNYGEPVDLSDVRMLEQCEVSMP